VYESVEDLANLAGIETGGTYTVILGSGINISDRWADISSAIRAAKKHVVLDLSQCVVTDSVIAGALAPTGNDFNIIRYNPYITGLILPQSLQFIDGYAFHNCISVESVILPDGLLSIGNNAFHTFTALKNITIPDSVTYIGSYAFYQCTGLTSIPIPYGITTIEMNCFGGCTGLTSFSIPDTVTTIGAGAYAGCNGLSGSLVIPASVTSIMGFSNCTNITEVVFPARDTPITVGNNSFSNCTVLTSVVFEDTNVTITNNNSFPSTVTSLKTAYEDGGAGTYTLSGGSWSKN
jgi:hypothetical protein